MAVDERCSTCVFYHRQEHASSDHGDCRRFPPSTLGGSSLTETAFPRVGGFDWCGEFKAKWAKKAKRA